MLPIVSNCIDNERLYLLHKQNVRQLSFLGLYVFKGVSLEILKPYLHIAELLRPLRSSQGFLDGLWMVREGQQSTVNLVISNATVPSRFPITLAENPHIQALLNSTKLTETVFRDSQTSIYRIESNPRKRSTFPRLSLAHSYIVTAFHLIQVQAQTHVLNHPQTCPTIDSAFCLSPASGLSYRQ